MALEIDWLPLFSDLAALLLFVSLLVAVVIHQRRARARRHAPQCPRAPVARPAPAVGTGRADEAIPYRIYTRDHDLEIHGAELPATLRHASPAYERNRSDSGGVSWRRNLEQVAKLVPSQPPVDRLTATIGAGLGAAYVPPGGVAITLLADQSGSMRGLPIAAEAAALDQLSHALVQLGIRHEILGFSTAGWHGGFPREQWIRSGHPKSPGRLCALLHILYKRFDETEWSEQSRNAFVHPDALRENVDGEALAWAAGRLRQQDAGLRLLIILSDGAPVDDSTLLENPPDTLERHLLDVIAGIAETGAIRLGGVGIGHDVGRYYPHARQAAVLDIAAATAALIVDCLQAATQLAETPSC